MDGKTTKEIVEHLMGKYATYRKRGGASATPAGPMPPPTPQLRITDDTLFQDPQGVDDTGGSCKLYHSVLEGGPYTLLATEDWASPKLWDDIENYDLGFVVSTEVGNGTAYVGESPQSTPKAVGV